MPGKLCTGVSTQYGFLPKESKAFSEGVYYRAGGTLLGRPVTDNPHPASSSANAAWTAGWTVSDAVAPSGTITASNAPCVAVPTNVVVDT
jgi:hypothetical protein